MKLSSTVKNLDLQQAAANQMQVMRNSHSIQSSQPKRSFYLELSENIQINLKIQANTTCEQLLQICIEQAKNARDPSYKEIIGLMTAYQNEVIDSLLLCPERTIDVISENEIFRPVYSQKLPNRKNVHINDLDFLKCIGKGGSSEVYLGKHPRRSGVGLARTEIFISFPFFRHYFRIAIN